MSKGIVLLNFLLLILIAGMFYHPPVVLGQSSNGVLTILQVGAPSSCAWPSGATVSSGMALCATNQGLYWAVNMGAFSPVAPPQQGLPTSENCTTATLGPTGFSATGCTFK